MKHLLFLLVGALSALTAHATLSTGPGGSGVLVGDSSLITTLQYSDTFTVGSPDRPDAGFPVDPGGLVVENSYGNPTRSWSGLLSSTLNTDSNAYAGYPGGSGAGSATGMTQNGGVQQTMMLQYNSLSTDIVIQFDAIQTAGGDRVSIFLSDSTNPYADNSLGIFFRQTGTGPFELGIYSPTYGEVNSGLASGIVNSAVWNNYAIHLNGSIATFFVNEVSLGTIDLATFYPDFDYSGYSTDYIGFGVDGGGTIKWADNFQVGSQPGGVAVGNSTLINTLQYSDTFTVGSADRPDGGFPVDPGGLVVENSYGNPTRSWPSATEYGTGNTDSNAYAGYPGGSGAGSATGMTQNGGLRQTMMLQYNSLSTDIVIQFDAIQTAGGDRVSIFLSDSTNPYAGNSLGIFFRQTGIGPFELGIYSPTYGEVNSGLATGITSAAVWNNYAVHLNGSIATFYVNQVSLGTIDLATFYPDFDYSGYSTDYIGFGVDGRGTIVGFGSIKWVDNFQVGTAASSGSYASWAGAFTNPVLSDTASTADPDNDGLTNAVEYALGLDPRFSSGSPGVFSNGGNTITFTKGAEAKTDNQVTYQIETSISLGAQPTPWTVNVADVTETADTIAITFPAGPAKDFARLKVTLATP